MSAQVILRGLLWLLLACSTIWVNAQGMQPWHEQTVVYQIYPRSFQDSDGDGIGDLNGIRERLDYLKELGVETIWISPFFDSPQGDWGYDIRDYRAIAEEYGTMEDFRNLVKEAHEMGLRIVLDMVMNHTSNQHGWFRQSENRAEGYEDFYLWTDGKGKRGKRTPVNWKSLGTKGWIYSDTRKQFYWSSFLPFQPDLNYRNPAVKKAMFDMVRFWLDEGVDGFRLDMFNAIYEDSLLRDNPFCLKAVPKEDDPDGYFQRALYNMNQPESYGFATELRAVLDEYDGNRYLVGEVYGTPAQMKQFCRYDGKSGLNSVFLFETMTTDFKADAFREMVKKFEQEFPAPALPTYVFSNHDRMRSFTRLGSDIRKSKLLALFQLTVRGIPFIYYGEEIGMEQARIPKKAAFDPLAHRYPLLPNWLVRMTGQSLNRDECRTPMHWDDTEEGGFTTFSGTNWIEFNPSPLGGTAVQKTDEQSLWRCYQSILRLRKNQPALRLGSMFIPEEMQSKQLLTLGRAAGTDTLLVLMNFSEKPIPVTEFASASILFSTSNQKIEATLSAWEGRVIKP